MYFSIEKEIDRLRSYLESEGQRRRSLLGLIGGEHIQQHAMVEMDFIGMLEPHGVIIGFF